MTTDISQRTTNKSHMNNPPNSPQTRAPEARQWTQNDAAKLGHQAESEPPELSEEKILDSADAFYARHGDWPRWDSGPIPELAGETWFTVSGALVLGLSGFQAGGSLSGFLTRHDRVRPNAPDENLSVGPIMAWAKAWRKRRGSWPTTCSGEIPGQGGLTWSTVDKLLRDGRAGLPAGTSLALLRRADRQAAEQTPLTQQQILGWLDDHYRRTGRWPASTSGRILDAPGETWFNVSLALMRGSRGLRGTLVAQRAAEKISRCQEQGRLARLSIPQILAWADAHHARTGKWPSQLSGAILEAPGESWQKVQSALCHGSRGLPGRSGLAQLLTAERGVRNRRRPPDLTVPQILAWADAFHARNACEPNLKSGPIPEAPGETWGSVEAALRAGARGLAGAPRLTDLLAEHRGWGYPRAGPH